MAKNTNAKSTNEKEKKVKKTTNSVVSKTKKIAKKVPAKTQNKKSNVASKKATIKKESLKEFSTSKKEKINADDFIDKVSSTLSKFSKEFKELNDEIFDIAEKPIKKSIKKNKSKNNSLTIPNEVNLNSTSNSEVSIENGQIILKDHDPKSTLKNFNIVEYYDLPYRYNKTVVKILAQTPTTLFVYWEISDEDKNNLLKTYGENYFNSSKPILIVTNETKYYSFEVEINDFANSWYITLPEADCKYEVELARKSYDYNIAHNVAITNSNEIQMPNDKILYEDALNSLYKIPEGVYNSNNCNINKSLVYFKNIKTDSVVSKEFNTLTSKTIYDIYSLYAKMYGKDFLSTLSSSKINLPSSGAMSSFK